VDEGTLLQQLARQWSLRDVWTKPLSGGMNSITHAVGSDGDKPAYVAKWVTSDLVEELVTGCETAAALAADGLVTGRPVPTSRGDLTVPVDGGALALLEYVPGRELTGENEEEQRLIGEALGRVHSVTSSGPRRGGFEDWLKPSPPATAQVAWLPRALDRVRREFDSLPALTWATLHTDPAPEAFVSDDATGVVGLIDWAGSRPGPVLYDVASAVMYLGGPDASAPFLEAYQASGLLMPGELKQLDALRRFRWGVQAAYFAQRLVNDDDTGLEEDPDGNERGLEAARRGLEALGLRCGT
jgi:Ser/Thr protein kinase RdoA (MazF antagonist)